MSERDLYQQDLFPIPYPSSPQELKKRFPYQFAGPSKQGGATLPQFWISEEADLGAQA